MSMIGQTIAHYEMTEKLGQGGMGEVYRATDGKLNREVALKILPESFAGDTHRMGRFHREAQVLASLNHPGIAAIYGVEEEDGRHALVMELVEGEDLSQRISRGPIPLEEALPIALQIAEALEDAHEKGVIHRDLKPANVRITPEGKAKVLDFGLAKALEGEVGQDPNLSQSPTLTMAATQIGMILGTASYMSPEQARGKPVDKRTDIWAFGVVLLEMLTGRKVFQGEDLSLTLASVMKDDPDWDRLPKTTPAPIVRLVRRCLVRDPTLRLRDIGDARIRLQEYLADPSAHELDAAAPDGPVGRRGAPRWLLAAAAASAGIAAFLGWSLKPLPPPIPQPPMRSAVVLPSPRALTDTGRGLLDLSPDGTHLVYAADNRLFLRAMDRLEATPIRGSEGARTPTFSPDGQWVVFWTNAGHSGQLMKVSISGGIPVTLTETTINPSGIDWTDDGRILLGQHEGVFEVGDGGGPKTPLLKVESGRAALPQVLPGLQKVLFTHSLSPYGDWDDSQIVVQSLETDQRKVVVERGMGARYLPSGHLVFLQDATLWAAAFDLDSLEVRGDALPVVEGIRRSSTIPGGQFRTSRRGGLAYVSGGAVTSRRLVWVDRSGKEVEMEIEPRALDQPRLSPDGALLAVQIDGDLWTHDLTRATTTRLTFDGGSRPAWTPDSKQIAFTHQDTLFMVAADGSRQPERLIAVDGDSEGVGGMRHSNAISPDGQTLLFHDHNQDQGKANDILTLRLDGASQPRPLLATDFNEMGAGFSPDGKWIVYFSEASGQSEIYIRPFPGPGGRIQISTEGGRQPLWGSNGEVFYRQHDRMMAVRIQTEPELTVERPQVLFEGRYRYGNAGQFAGYDVSRDGQRFVMIREGEDSSPGKQQIIHVLNWFEELERLVPTDP